MDLVTLLVHLGGVADTGTLLANISRRALRTAVDRREVVRIGRNRYALPVVEDALRQAHEHNAFVTHLSAAAHWGWEVRLPPDRPQLAVPRGRALPEIEGADLRRLDLPREVIHGWATTKLQTVLMCAADLSFGDALAVADSALRHRDVTPSQLTGAAAAFTGARGTAVRTVASYADGKAANAFESATRALAIEAGLSVIPQYRVEIDGTVLHPDLADPLRGIVIEAESWEFHGKRQADFERDCERYTLLTLDGWLVLRFTWRQVIHRPAWVMARMADAAAAAARCA
ncbi:hypothetical protein JCM18899A_01150 [Nocardioides sp. AN3]